MKETFKQYSRPPKLSKGLGLLIQGVLLVIAGIAVYQNYFTAGPTQEEFNNSVSEAHLISILQSTQVTDKVKLQGKQLKIAALGEKLFFDTKLSSDNKVSCATCHQPEKFFTDQQPTASTRSILHRNTPTVVNSGYLPWLFWDGRAISLSDQIRGPLESEHEQLSNWSHLAKTIQKFYKEEYQELFEDIPQWVLNSKDALPQPPKNLLSPKIAAFALSTLQDSPLQKKILSKAQKLKVAPATLVSQYISQFSSSEKQKTMYANFEELNTKQKQELQKILQNIGKALAYYQSSLQALDSPYDRFSKRALESKSIEESFGDNFKEQELQGMQLFFGKARCSSCHFGELFTDNGFHNIGVPPHMRDGQPQIDFARAGSLLQLQKAAPTCEEHILAFHTNNACEELKYINTEAIETLGAFRTPSLRNLKLTAPYFHAGQAKTLKEVIDFYVDPPLKTPIGEVEGSLIPIQLTNKEKSSLISFLLSLSSEIETN